MIIKFSRHAKRRPKLYNIPKSVVKNVLENLNLKRDKHEIVKEVAGFKYPTKMVVVVEENIITVITNYPLKKGVKGGCCKILFLSVYPAFGEISDRQG